MLKYLSLFGALLNPWGSAEPFGIEKRGAEEVSIVIYITMENTLCTVLMP